MSDLKRVQVVYTGEVQGVGFRFTTRDIASTIGITGYVKNMYDGTVLAVGEGAKSQLDTFLASITNAMSGYISDSKIEWQDATGEFSSFNIEF